jgi:hypothetical protein
VPACRGHAPLVSNGATVVAPPCCCCWARGAMAEGSTSFSAQLPDWITALGIIVSAVVAITGYILERGKDRAAAALQARLAREQREGEARSTLQHLCNEAELKRVRQQLELFVGPVHRRLKASNTAVNGFCIVRGNYPDQFQHFSSLMKATPVFGPFFAPALCEELTADPDGTKADEYRELVRDYMLPHWIRIRQLILDHGSDLAEQPAPEQWEHKWKAEQLEAPGTKATNFLSVLDNAVVWVRELELLVTRS